MLKVTVREDESLRAPRTFLGIFMFLDDARMLTLAGLAAVASRSRWLKGLNFKWAKVR